MNARRVTLELVRRGDGVAWKATYPSGSYRYHDAGGMSLGGVMLSLMRVTGDEVVVLPAGWSLTYNAHVKEAL